MKILLSRKDVPVQETWDLSTIYKSRDEWMAAIDSFNNLLDEIIKMKGGLFDSNRLFECLTKIDCAGSTLQSINAYARLKYDEDTTNNDAQKDWMLARELIDKGNAAVSFLKPYLLKLPEQKIAKLHEEHPGLKKYKFYFDNICRTKRHILSEEEENLFSHTGELRDAPYMIYNSFVNADMKFPEIFDDRGNRIVLSKSRAIKLMSSKDREVRKSAFENLFGTYNRYRNTFATMYSSSVKAKVFDSKVHKFNSAMAQSLYENNIPIMLYDMAVDITNEYLQLLHRYMKLKKKILAIDDFCYFDIFAEPFEPSVNNYTYDDGCILIKNALAPLGEKYQRLLDLAMGNRWIDYLENDGKKSGAYTLNVYLAHPYILMSWQNTYKSVTTLAHELGHAIHSYFSNKNQEYITSTYKIFCAEIVSAVNENLLIDYNYRIAGEKEKTYYQYFLLENIHRTVYRQIMYAEFEKYTYEMVESGRSLSADVLDDKWLNLVRAYYGDVVNSEKIVGNEWSQIPHFYRPFYVYQYATGFVSAMAITDGFTI